ncbi:hypothetical protein [Luteibacter sp. CQ10]|uniref:hypothetical protein n=1 Tax=Luteibacter sp. CQ10 TaxID=2805821 RepID=UPI0034A25260
MNPLSAVTPSPSTSFASSVAGATDAQSSIVSRSPEDASFGQGGGIPQGSAEAEGKLTPKDWMGFFQKGMDFIQNVVSSIASAAGSIASAVSSVAAKIPGM